MKIILVIEDEKAIRQNIVKILNHKGFQAVHAADGEEGVEKAIAYNPDLIICDIMMPGCDGYEVLNQLRQIPDTNSIPFIFLSAKVDKPDVRQGMNLGADDYLTKPFTSAELIEAVTARLKRQDAIAQPYRQEMKRAAENLNQLAFYDAVTNLPNLILLYQRLQDQLAVITQSSETLIAVLRLRCLHQDGIGQRSRPLSDSLIITIAERLQIFARNSNTTTDRWVARLGSDEFAVVLPQILVPEDVIAELEQLLETLSVPYEVEQASISLSTSIGVALYPKDGQTPSVLLSHAEIALHYCIADDARQYCLYEYHMAEAYTLRKKLLDDLQTALTKSEFQLMYQPQVNLVTERIVGVEALLRWQHPEQGQLTPDAFIPVVEQADLLVDLGKWIIQTACQQMQTWRSLTLVPLQLSVNLWPQQIQDKHFLSNTLQALREADLSPNQLVLDISESCLMAFEFEAIAQIFEDIAATGIQIAIDGFGMRCMPLQYLKRLPIHMLKLDKSFIDHIVDDERDAMITEAIIAMAQNLKLKVLAKGIEREEQLSMLTKHGCHVMQGYLYSPPVTPDALESLLVPGTSSSL